MTESASADAPLLFPHENWITPDAVERCTCYQRADGEIVKHGWSQLLSRSGFVYEEGELRHGLRHAVWRSYHDNGRIKSISQYSNGLENGLYQEWYDTGVLRYEWMKQDGHSHGRHRSYHQNGNLKEDAMLEDDLMHGPCQVWDEDGVLLADGVYEQGSPVEGTFIIDEVIEPGPNYPNFNQYMDAFLNRRRAVVEIRNGEAICGRRLPPRR